MLDHITDPYPSRVADPYPSRVGGEPRVLPRLDPVIYGARGPAAALDAAAQRDYDRDGYLFFPGFFAADDVAPLQAELERLRQDPALARRDEAISEPGSGDLRSIFAIHQLSPVFAALAAHPRLVALARFILGDEVYIHQSRLNYKPGFTGKEFYWHSDFETWHVEDGMPRMRALSMSIILSENSEFNGPLMLMPGSHRSFAACVGATPDDHYKQSLKKQEYGVPAAEILTEFARAGGIVAPKGPPGSLIVFDCNTMHGSNGNISPFPRSNAFFVYNALANRLTAPAFGLKPRPKFIAHRD